MVKVAGYIVFGDESRPIEPELLEMAQKFYRAAISAGDERAMIDVGAMYYTGRGVEQDFAKALHWYKKAADLGSVQAMNNLGYCYYYGRSIPIDYEKAYQMYTRAALLGSVNSLYKVGDMYMWGKYVEKNKHIAFRIYGQCCDRLDEAPYDAPDVFLRLGGCFRRGDGTEINMEIAEKLLSQAKLGFRERVDNGDIFAKGSLKRAEEEWAEAFKALESASDE